MTARERNHNDAFGRISAFGTKNAKDWTPVPPAVATDAQTNIKNLFLALGRPEPSAGPATGVIAKMEAYAVAQEASKADFHAGTTAKANSRGGIMRRLRKINRAAGTISEKLRQPELMDNFRMPHGVSDAVLVARAGSFAQHAQALEAEFLLLSFPAGFIQDLTDRVAAFAKARLGKGAGLGEQVGSTAALDSGMEEGQLIASQLDVIMENLYEDDPAKLAEWHSASHVERTGKKKQGDDQPSDPPAPGGGTPSKPA